MLFFQHNFFKYIQTKQRISNVFQKFTLIALWVSAVFWISLLLIFYDILQGNCWTKTLLCDPIQQGAAIETEVNALPRLPSSPNIETTTFNICKISRRSSIKGESELHAIFCKTPSIFSKLYQRMPSAIQYSIPNIHFVSENVPQFSPETLVGVPDILKQDALKNEPQHKQSKTTLEHQQKPNLVTSQILAKTIALYSFFTHRFLNNCLFNYFPARLVKTSSLFRSKNGIEVSPKFFFLTSNKYRNQQLQSLFSRMHKNVSREKDSLKDIKTEVQSFVKMKIIENKLQTSPQAQALKSHSYEFQRRIQRIVENVYIGIGYGLANIAVIQGNSGLIVIDTLESPIAMREFMHDLKTFISRQRVSTQSNISIFPASLHHNNGEIPLKHSNMSVSCVIYTHFHSDHIFGASEIVIPGVTPVWAHEKTLAEIERVFGLVGGATYKRAMYQFGSFLSEEDGYLNAGIGKWLRYSATPQKNETLSLVKPTNTWAGIQKRLDIDGVTLDLLFAPGESPDQTVVWMPSKELLFGADNIYKAFPNIYAIRGTQSRDAMQSLDRMRFLLPKYLLLGHTSPLEGKYFIWNTITAYRDAIQYVHDQTVRYMNKGYPVDKIVEAVRLPKHLQEHEYLQEFYGTVQWGIRAVFQHYIGWFSGSAEDLHPLSSGERAKFMADLAGGRRILLEKSFKALKEEHYQWALELAIHAQKLDPLCSTSRDLRILALKGLASKETSAPGRNWYLTSAKLEREKGAPNSVGYSFSRGSPKSKEVPISELLRLSTAQKKQSIDSMQQVDDIFKHFSVRTRDDLLAEQDLVIGFRFTDVQVFTCWHVRRGVAYPRRTCERQTTFDVTTTDAAWRKILKGEIRPLLAIATGHFRISGGRARDYWVLKQVMAAIETTLE